MSIINRSLLIAGILTMLAGCASLEDVANKGAQVNDEAVSAAEFTICNGASVGSIRRSFGSRPNVWLDLCGDSFSFEK